MILFVWSRGLGCLEDEVIVFCVYALCRYFVDVGMCMHMYERKIGKVRNSPALILSFLR